jgi:hypothetical protein
VHCGYILQEAIYNRQVDKLLSIALVTIVVKCTVANCAITHSCLLHTSVLCLNSQRSCCYIAIISGISFTKFIVVQLSTIAEMPEEVGAKPRRRTKRAALATV